MKIREDFKKSDAQYLIEDQWYTEPISKRVVPYPDGKIYLVAINITR